MITTMTAFLFLPVPCLRGLLALAVCVLVAVAAGLVLTLIEEVWRR